MVCGLGEVSLTLWAVHRAIYNFVEVVKSGQRSDQNFDCTGNTFMNLITRRSPIETAVGGVFSS